MKHLHLLIPDLFPPQDIAGEVCAGLHLSALEKLLARGRKCGVPISTLEDRLCTEFTANGVAPVRAVADGLDVGDDYWLCADPVSLQLQRAQMLLLPDVMVSQAEADTLCAMLNEHFNQMGMRFFSPHPQRWYVKFEAEPQMTTIPLRQAAYRDTKHHQPQGVDALRWQRYITEIQMLLYAHPINQEREARGESVISSLWLWGGGRVTQMKSPFDAIGGDSRLANVFRQAVDLPQIGFFQTLLGEKYENALWVCEALSDAWQRGDFHSWRESIQKFELECAQPLLKALQAGRIQWVTLEVLQGSSSQCFDLTRGDAWALWRYPRTLARYAVL